LSSSARPSTFGGKWSSPGNHHSLQSTACSAEVSPYPLLGMRFQDRAMVGRRWLWEEALDRPPEAFLFEWKTRSGRTFRRRKISNYYCDAASQSTNRKSASKGRTQAALRFRCTLSPHAMESPAERSDPRNSAVYGAQSLPIFRTTKFYPSRFSHTRRLRSLLGCSF
jgi:hypothetical protein